MKEIIGSVVHVHTDDQFFVDIQQPKKESARHHIGMSRHLISFRVIVAAARPMVFNPILNIQGNGSDFSVKKTSRNPLVISKQLASCSRFFPKRKTLHLPNVLAIASEVYSKETYLKTVSNPRRTIEKIF